MTIRVVLVDDQKLLRAGFRVLIEAADDLSVVGEADDGEQAIEVVKASRADVVLMDIRMPGVDGLEATRRITSDEDLAGVKVVILTTFDLDEYVFEAVRAGASGFLSKSAEPEDLRSAIRIVARGDALLSPRATHALMSAFADAHRRTETSRTADPGVLDVLTVREREVMTLVAHGLSNEAIAERLFLSVMTAKTHVNRAMAKLDVRDRAQFVVLAYQTGLVSPGDLAAP